MTLLQLGCAPSEMRRRGISPAEVYDLTAARLAHEALAAGEGADDGDD